MKLRTSFCNLTALKKDFTRFAPFWAIYLIGGLLVMLTITGSFLRAGNGGEAARTLASIMGPFSIINMLYAALVAQLLFGDLYQTRLCYALHAMPLRREQWFACHSIAGLCFSIVPHLIVVPLMMLRLQSFWYVALIWLLSMTLQYLFFFGLAVFCSFCVGNRFAQVAVYAILNFVAVIAYWFCVTVFQPLMYGVELRIDPFRIFCPVVQMCASGSMVIISRDRMESTDLGQRWVYTFEGWGGGWGYLAVCAVLGVVLLIGALLLYRRRKLESAGDFIAVKPLVPVFSVVFTLCVGAVCAMFGELFSEGYLVVFLGVGLVVGYFVGQMLLQRTAKVFKGVAFVRLGILLAAMVLSVLLVKWDAFYIVRWIPDPEDIKSISLGYDGVEVEDEEDFRLVLLIHRLALEDGEAPLANERTYLPITYTMKSGRQVSRNYMVRTQSDAYQALKLIYSRVTAVLGQEAADWERYLQGVEEVRIEDTLLDNAAAREILEAVKQDCRAGTMSQRYAFHRGDPVFHLEIRREDNQGISYYHTVAVYSDAANTQAALKEYRMDISKFLGLECSWEDFLKRLICIQWNGGVAIEDPEEMASLMEAVKKDCAEGKLDPEDGRNKKGTLYIVWGNEMGVKSDARDIAYYYNCNHILDWLWEHYPEEMGAGY